MCGLPFQAARRRPLRPLGSLLGGSVAAGIAFALIGSLMWTVFAFLMGVGFWLLDMFLLWATKALLGRGG